MQNRLIKNNITKERNKENYVNLTKNIILNIKK